MTQLDKDTIRKLNELTKIGCSNKEFEEQLLVDLQNILDFVEQLNEVETEHVEPTYHVDASLYCPLRSDVVVEEFSSKDFLKNCPDSVSQMVRIPPVFNEELVS